MSRRLSFTERRRARLALKSARLDRLETRNTMTEPISVTALSLTAFRGLAQLGMMHSDGGNSALLALTEAARQAKQGLVGQHPAAARAQADRAERARASGDPADAADAGTEAARALAQVDQMLAAIPEDRRPPRGIACRTLTGAEATRAAGRSDPRERSEDSWPDAAVEICDRTSVCRSTQGPRWPSEHVLRNR